MLQRTDNANVCYVYFLKHNGKLIIMYFVKINQESWICRDRDTEQKIFCKWKMFC